MATLSPAMQIADRAEHLKVTVLAQQLTLPALLDPRLPILEYLLSSAGVPLDGDSRVSLTPNDGSAPLNLSARQILASVAKVPSDLVWEDLASGTMLVGAIRLGDMIDGFGFRDGASPLMEFARHFRNACAHGDRWHFVRDEPRRPAATRQVHLDASMNGTKATWTTVSPREYVEYLDEVRAHFLTLALRQSMREAQELVDPDHPESVANLFFERLSQNGVPQNNQDWLVGIAEALSIGQDISPTFTPPLYERD